MTLAIEARDLTKRYRIGARVEPYQTLRETLASLFRAPSRSKVEFDALKDVSFDVAPGESVAIVGRNGAGKSTLLKILSRITLPTSGFARVRGRAASLLEVGTGFHPELTGRENILLNGAILGMKSADVLRRFDQIVDFSGVEAFLETPIKRYSSGMQLRLAFAVAAHLEPEILIIDEVLAVGDAAFQRKCLARMEQVSGEGRTVLFVSHNLSAVSSLCERGILLEGGRVVEDADVRSVVSTYMTGEHGQDRMHARPEPHAAGDETAVVREVGIRTASSPGASLVPVGEEVLVEMRYEILKPGGRPVPNYHLTTAEGLRIATLVDPDRGLPADPGHYRSTLRLPGNFFNEGTFVVGVSLSTLDPVQVHYQNERLLSFEVVDDLDSPTRNLYRGKFPAPLRPLFEWSNVREDPV